MLDDKFYLLVTGEIRITLDLRSYRSTREAIDYLETGRGWSRKDAWNYLQSIKKETRG